MTWVPVCIMLCVVKTSKSNWSQKEVYQEAHLFWISTEEYRWVGYWAGEQGLWNPTEPAFGNFWAERAHSMQLGRRS